MNDRARAIFILKQAQRILQERLTERITDLQEEIVEDAQGACYSGEIEAIQDQLGSRLGSVNNMLVNLQAGGGLDADLVEDEHGKESGPLGPDLMRNLFAPRPSDPQQMVSAADAAQAKPPPEPSDVEPNFAGFLKQVRGGDLDLAGKILATLLEVDQQRGRLCAARFQEQLVRSPEFLAKAMSLRHELLTGSINDALMLLWECFGLQGPESIGAMQALKARLADS